MTPGTQQLNWTQVGSRLSVEDIGKAEESLVSYVQQQSFRDELNSLQKNIPVKRNSRIYKLDPILQKRTPKSWLAD